MKYADAKERRQAILDNLRTTGFLSISVAANELGVTEMTIRRDLRQLRNEAPIALIHGGARMMPTSGHSDYGTRASVEPEAKDAIAREACRLIGDADTIALDAGTTALAVARQLGPSFHGCVVTPSLPVLNQLVTRTDLRVITLAGELHRPSLAFAGPMTVEAARHLRVSTFFLGAAAVDERGIYVAADIERSSKLSLMENADRIVLLADRTKFSRTAPLRLCSLDKIDILITNHDDNELKSELTVIRTNAA